MKMEEEKGKEEGRERSGKVIFIGYLCPTGFFFSAMKPYYLRLFHLSAQLLSFTQYIVLEWREDC
jgi:hypothetical protein